MDSKNTHVYENQINVLHIKHKNTLKKIKYENEKNISQIKIEQNIKNNIFICTENKIHITKKILDYIKQCLMLA